MSKSQLRKRKAKGSPRRKATRPSSDKAIVREGVIYAQSIVAYKNGFKADPGRSCDTAATLGDLHTKRARQALTKIAATPATTPIGLCLKARIVAVVFEDNQEGCLEPEAEAFLISFGADVHKFLQPICNGTVTLQTATEGKVAS